MLKATVSGSFHRHMDAITRAVYELATLSVHVLSPADPRIVAQQGEFLFVASDPVRSVRLVQDRHLESIRAANFLWLVCPDGYVGQSASMEIGFAAGASVPIFATRPPSDLTLREYVSVVPSLPEAVRLVAGRPQRRVRQGVLINPRASIEEAQASLEHLKAALLRPSQSGESAQIAHFELAKIQTTLRLPTSVQ
jgi:hypothetical protein